MDKFGLSPLLIANQYVMVGGNIIEVGTFESLLGAKNLVAKTGANKTTKENSGAEAATGEVTS